MERKIYFDESFPKYVVETISKLAAQLPNFKVAIAATRDILSRNGSDIELVKHLEAEHAWLVMREISPQRARLEAQLLVQYGIPIFFLQLPKGEDQVWQSNKVLSSNLIQMLRIVNDPTASSAYRIKAKGKIEPIEIF